MRRLSEAEAGTLARLRARDPDAVDQHGHRLTVVIAATWHGIGHPDLEEILADVLADAWFMAGAIDLARGSIGDWMTMRARYRTLDCLRAVRRGRRLVGRIGALMRPEASSPEYASEIDAYIAGLDELSRQLAWLRFVEGRPIREVANACGLTPKAAERRLDRLRDRLRRYVDLSSREVPGDV